MSSEEAGMLSSLSLEADQQQLLPRRHGTADEHQDEEDEENQGKDEGAKEDRKEEFETLNAPRKRVRSFLQASDSSLQVHFLF
jgi:hypothetical protein